MVGHMAPQTRRDFLKTSAAVAAAVSTGVLTPAAGASPLGLPLGLQLYSVREELPKDYEGTLKTVASLGYKEVEAAGFYGRSAADVKRAMTAAGLRCVSAHYPWSQIEGKVDSLIDYHHTLGAEYIICASPGFKDANHHEHELTLDDWRWNAEQFNHVGEKVKAAGLRFGYHNHTGEFAEHDGVLPYDELLRLTDPKLVTFEMDCGWVVVGGHDPVAYLQKHADRISMLHVKDFKHTDKPMSSHNPPPAAELGRGTTDYRKIFAAAKKSNIRHAFVEQEEFNVPWKEALKIDADYMQAL